VSTAGDVSLWRNRDYVGWLVGETLSTLGTSLSTFAYPLLILFATHSPARTGIVAAAGNIGSLATVLIGGALADRYSRRMLMIVGPVLQGLVVLSVGVAVLAGHVVLVHVAAAGFVDGAIVGVTDAAGRAALRRLVPREQYPSAVSQYFVRDSGVRIAGPPFGGVLFAASRALPFLADAISYLAAVAGAATIRRPLGPDVSETRERESLPRSVAAGVRFLLGNGYLRFLAWWAAVMNMLGSGLMLLVILLVRAQGGSATVIGATQAIGATGGILGALATGWVVRRLAGRLIVIALSWAMAAAAFAMSALPPWGIGLMVSVVSFVAVPLNVTFDTYEMQIIPDEMLGRVTTTINLAANGLRWLAPLTVGLLVEATSAKVTALIWGGAFVVVTLLVMANRSVRVLNRPVVEVAAPS
jgi:MFS family permease